MTAARAGGEERLVTLGVLAVVRNDEHADDNADEPRGVAEGRASPPSDRPGHHSATASRNQRSPPGSSPSSASASASVSGQNALPTLSASAPSTQYAAVRMAAGTGA